MYPFAMVPGQAEPPLGATARERAIAGAEAERERHRDDDPNLRSCEAVVCYHIRAIDGAAAMTAWSMTRRPKASCVKSRSAPLAPHHWRSLSIR